MVDDQKVINNIRCEEGEIALDLDKTLTQHFTSLEDEQKINSDYVNKDDPLLMTFLIQVRAQHAIALIALTDMILQVTPK